MPYKDVRLRRHRCRWQITPAHNAFSLVEMLVVISIVGVLLAMLFPALQAARVAGRQVACKNNLRQFGIAMHEHAIRRSGRFCSGAFDWRHDGCVTETGWVADMVQSGVPVGTMLCPGNPRRLSETYNDLLDWNAVSDGCVDLAGSEEQLAPDGSPIVNPCRRIVDSPLAAGSAERTALVEQLIYNEFYNTNYTASWFLVRWGVVLDESGNLRSSKPACAASLASRNSTLGPLSRIFLDTSGAPSSLLPLLGDGAATGILQHPLARHRRGESLVKSFTKGPVQITTMQAPTFADGTSREGPAGWWKTWARDTLQDYRGFAPVHGNRCNILFADGSVRTLTDQNGDGLLNNGFPATVDNGFSDTRIDLPTEEVFSRWSID